MKVNTQYYGERRLKLVSDSELIIVNGENYYVATITIRKNDQIACGKCKRKDNYKIEILGVIDSKGNEVLPFKYSKSNVKIMPYHHNTFLLEFYAHGTNGYPNDYWEEVFEIRNGKAESLVKSYKPIVVIYPSEKQLIAREFDFDEHGYPIGEKTIIYDLYNREMVDIIYGSVICNIDKDNLCIRRYEGRSTKYYSYNLTNNELLPIDGNVLSRKM